jgi:multiple antibiotic resistance protein
MTSRLGRSKAQIVTRLAAFLLLCVGTQIALSGITDFVHGL